MGRLPRKCGVPIDSGVASAHLLSRCRAGTQVGRQGHD